MKRTRTTLGIVLACLCLPPLIIGGLLEAGHYTFRTWTNSSNRRFWFAGRTGVIVNDNYMSPVPGYGLVLYKYGIEAYRPQDILPSRHGYVISARIVDKQGHGVSESEIEVYNLAGQRVEDPLMRVYKSGNNGKVSQCVPDLGAYDVVVNRHGYLPIKKHVQVGPNGAFVKFILPHILHAGGPSHKPPANARS